LFLLERGLVASLAGRAASSAGQLREVRVLMVKHLHQKKVYVTLSGRKPQLAVRCVVSATEVILPVRVQTVGRDGLRPTVLNLKLNICLMLHCFSFSAA